MKCNACGRDVPAESVFCPQCGAQLDGGDDALAANSGPPNAQRLKPGNARGSGQQPAEADLWSGTYSAKAMAGPAVGLGILTILVVAGGLFFPPLGLPIAVVVALVMWGWLGLALLYRRLTVHYRLTTFRLFHEAGLLSRKRDRIEVIDINDVTLRQGIVERMFNTGTIHIESSDTSDPEFDMPGIDDVRNVADLIDNTRRAERQRRGLFMENI
jgi:membrane protein YdbS with pleckstrin-like domain